MRDNEATARNAVAGLAVAAGREHIEREHTFDTMLARQLALFASAAAPTRLVGDRGDVTYVPEFLDKQLADAVVRELSADTQWRADSRMMYGKRVLVPREVAGRGEKMPQPWTPALRLVREMCERHTGTTFDYCFLNRYRDGNDAVAWHGDRDGSRDARLVVASLSLGATRTFQLRPKKDSGLRYDPVSVDVTHGDLIVMAGDTQLYWEHRVPRDPHVRETRLNVTFRQHRAREERHPEPVEGWMTETCYAAAVGVNCASSVLPVSAVVDEKPPPTTLATSSK